MNLYVTGTGLAYQGSFPSSRPQSHPQLSPRTGPLDSFFESFCSPSKDGAQATEELARFLTERVRERKLNSTHLLRRM